MKGFLDCQPIDVSETKPNAKMLAVERELQSRTQDETKKQRIRKVLTDIEKLPVLPSTVYKVIRMVNNPDTRAADFVELFSKDPTLAARLLRIANSAFYGMDGKIKTISKAVVVLGFGTLKNIVLASTSTVLFKQASTEYGFKKNGLWLHSVSVAQLVRHLTKNWSGFSTEVADEMFVVGLLHDIGKVLLCRELAKHRGEYNAHIRNGNVENVTAMERAILGIDHCEVGEIIVRRWNIGDDVADVIAGHHDHGSDQTDNGHHHAILVLADLLCNEARVGLTENCPWIRPISNKILRILKLDESSLSMIRDEARAIFAQSLELADMMT